MREAYSQSTCASTQAQRNSPETPQPSQQKTLRKQLANQAAAHCAQSGTHRHLALPNASADKE
jgi:putative hemolysin